jgi:hypothetical protein
MDIKNRELIIITLFVLGCIVDHITTLYGLKLPTITESNPFVLWMITAGVWNVIEVAIMLLGTASAFAIMRDNSKGLVSLSLVALGSVGIVRMYAGYLNITLILSIIS